MILKERTKSITHLILESLNARMTLSAHEKNQYEKQIKGFEGEQLFDECMMTNQPDGLIIQDLLLSTRDTFYQIDALLITDNRIYLYEIKNYSGCYNFKERTIYSTSGHALQDPVAQAERKRSYLFNLLMNMGHQIEVIPLVIYINPDFYIYDFPMNKSVIFAGQLASHFKTVTGEISKPTTLSTALAEKLIRLHNDLYRPQNMPNYKLDQLQQGIVCPNCFSFKHTISRQTRTCTHCGFKEPIAEAIYRSIKEYQRLFPDVPIKKQSIVEWCGNDLSKSRVQEVLKTQFCRKKNGRGSYYE